MANIQAVQNKTILRITKWLGLNESPDGDTGLRLGEASAMRNFRVTRESHLQIRPGYAPAVTLSAGQPVRGMWSGYVSETHHLLAACGGRLWDIDPDSGTASDCGEIADAKTSFFGCNNAVYLLTGAEYYRWDGENQVSPVEGYAPIVATATPPQGGGTLLEDVNLLTGKRRQVFSPDGAATMFHLAETGIDELVSVEGTGIAYSADLANGTVSFSSAPDEGTNTITITWRKGIGRRERVTAMRYAELFNGATDFRVFLYGDGSNQAVYSGLDQYGRASAEYFPDLNTAAVGDANTPLTALIRHYDRMLAFKTDSAYSIAYSTLVVTQGESDKTIAGFYISTLNREIGNAAPGQVRLVDNNARTIHGRTVYDWYLASNSVRDERNARRISDKVADSLGKMNLTQALTFDDEWNREYYIVADGKAVVQNYENGAWYLYTNFNAQCMERIRGDVYFGTADGRVMHVSRDYRNDAGAAIDAWWESGSIDFDRDWKRKYSSELWISIKPESQARIRMTARSNIKANYPEKIISSGLSTFSHVNFNHWSFGTNRRPQVIRSQLKIKKATYYKQIFCSRSASATATILGVDIQVRFTGNVK